LNCPNCDGNDIAIILGNCDDSRDEPKFECNDCNHRWSNETKITGEKA